MSKIKETMGNLMPVERVIEPNQNNLENYGDLQPIAPKYDTYIMGLE